MVQLTSTTVLLGFAYSAALISGRAINARMPDGLPDGTSMFAVDETTGKLVAFDASKNPLGEVAPQAKPPRMRRAVGACGAMSTDDIKKLPGWSKLEQKAKDNWGTGKYNLEVNPTDYTDQPANVCLQDDAVQLAPDAKPDCKTAQQDSDGQTLGSNLTVSLMYVSGTMYSASTSVTKESSIGTGLTVGGKAEIPGFEVSVSRSLDMSWTNSQNHAETKTDNAQTTSTVAQTAKDGQTCHLEVNTTSCDLQGTGKVAFLGTGWAWFNFEDKVQDHYKWALKMEDILSDEERSSFMEFKSSITTTTNSKYNSVCA